MIPAPFDYEVADSVEHAVKLLGEREDTKLLAGGHSLIPLMRLRFAPPAVLVDLGRLNSLRYVRDAGGQLAIGALTRHHDLNHDPLLQEHCPLVSHAAGLIGDRQVRHRGTIGGSIAHGDPASDLPAVLVALDAAVDLRGKRVAVQEYGIPNPELVSGLEQRGATVKTIPIYKWALPVDIEPLRVAIQKILNGEADVALFTNGAQVDHLFRLAAEDKADEKLRHALGNVVIASVGPVCTQVLEQYGVKPDIEPPHPKMGSLISAVAASAQHLLEAKSAL